MVSHRTLLCCAVVKCLRACMQPGYKPAVGDSKHVVQWCGALLAFIFTNACHSGLRQQRGARPPSRKAQNALALITHCNLRAICQGLCPVIHMGPWLRLSPPVVHVLLICIALCRALYA